MAEKKFVVPEILAILPVRDTVLFPGAVLPLTVGRESSLALVNAWRVKRSNWAWSPSLIRGWKTLPRRTSIR